MVLRTCSKIAVLCLITVSAHAGGFGWWAGVQGGDGYAPWDDADCVMWHDYASDDAPTYTDSASTNDGYNATANQQPTYVSANGGYLNYDGANDGYSLANAAEVSFAQGPYSLCVWFRTTTSTSDILFDSRVGGDYRGNLWRVVSGRLHWILDRGPSSITLTSTNVVNDNVWHFACAVKDGDNMHLYLDGASIATRTGATAYPNDSAGFQWGIGRYSLSATITPWQGDYKAPSLWSKALSPTEVETLYNESKAEYGF